MRVGRPSILVALLLSCGAAVLAAAATPSGRLPHSGRTDLHSDAAVHPDAWPASEVHPLIRPAVEAFVDELLRKMSLEEKVGQMIQADIGAIRPLDLQTYKLGAILAGGNSGPGGNVRSSAEAWLALSDRYHHQAMAVSGEAHPPIPLLFGIDAVHGHAKIPGATIFPHNIGLGAAHDPDLLWRIGAATAEEVRSTGIDWVFAPTVAVARDVRWGRSYESYSEDPLIVAQSAAAMVSGLQGAEATPQFLGPGHVLSTTKHFLGDGGTENGRDQGENLVPEDELLRVHGAAYPAAIKVGAAIVMVSYSSWRGSKMHGNHALLTNVLKGRFGFDGFVVGDWNAQEQVAGCTKFSCPAAINAGVDMLMAADSWKQAYANTLAQARMGQIPAARIDDAVRRILRVKALAGLFAASLPAQRLDAEQFEPLGSQRHRALAREAVRKSLVLLKNQNQLLPLNPHARVLVTGVGADNLAMQSGGWSIDWQGDHNSNADFPHATSIYRGISSAVEAAGGTAELSVDGSFSRRPNIAIVVTGERPYAEFEGDRDNLDFVADDRQTMALLGRLRAQRIPVVVIFLSGRPLWVNPEINKADAFVAAWLPGSEGEGIADVLFRSAGGAIAYDFSGRLSFSWPATGMPVRFNTNGLASGAQFPRGYGLNYAHAVTVMPLPEQAGVPEAWRTRRTLFHADHVTAPWTLQVAESVENPVRVTMRRQQSPAGAAALQLDPQGLHVEWAGGQAAQVLIAGRTSDLERLAQAGEVVRIRLRIERAPQGAVRLGLLCSAPYGTMVDNDSDAPAPNPEWSSCGVPGGARLDLSAWLARRPKGVWQTLEVPLQCFIQQGADLGSVDKPFELDTDGAFALTLADIRLSEGRRGASCALGRPMNPWERLGKDSTPASSNYRSEE